MSADFDLRFNISVEGASDAANQMSALGDSINQMSADSVDAASGMDGASQAIGRVGDASTQNAKKTESFGKALSNVSLFISTAISTGVGLVRAIDNIGVAQDRADRANLKVEKSTIAVERAQAKYSQAIAEFGVNSPQAAAALQDLNVKIQQNENNIASAAQAADRIGFAWTSAATEAAGFGASIAGIAGNISQVSGSLGTIKSVLSGVGSAFTGGATGAAGLATALATLGLAVGAVVSAIKTGEGSFHGFGAVLAAFEGNTTKAKDSYKRMVDSFAQAPTIGINAGQILQGLDALGVKIGNTKKQNEELLRSIPLVGNALADVAIAATNFGQQMSTAWQNVIQKVQAGDISGAFKAIEQAATQAGQGIINALAPVGQMMVKSFTNVPADISRAFSGVSAAITQSFTGVPTALGAVWSTIVNAARGATSQIAGAFAGIGQAITQGFQGIVSFLTPIWNSMVQGARTATSQIAGVFGQIGQAITQGFQGIVSFLTPIWNSMVQGARTATSQIAGVFSAIGQAIAQGFQSVVSFLTPIWNSIVNAARQATSQIAGVFAPIGNAIAQGFQGAANAVQGVWDKLVTSARQATSQIAGVFAPIGQAIAQGFDTTIAGKAIDELKRKATDMANGSYKPSVSLQDNATAGIRNISNMLTALPSNKLININIDQVTRTRTIAAAKGFAGLIAAPTRFLVGEGGRPEMVARTPVHAAAKGFDGLVKKPTFFMAGEAGPELVNVIPLARGSASGNDLARLVELFEKFMAMQRGGRQGMMNNANLFLDGQRLATSVSKYTGTKAYGDR